MTRSHVASAPPSSLSLGCSSDREPSKGNQAAVSTAGSVKEAQPDGVPCELVAAPEDEHGRAAVAALDKTAAAHSSPLTMRQRLRTETAREHEELEQVVDSFVLSSRDGLSRFIAMHRLAFDYVAAHPAPLISQPLLDALMCRAERDLGPWESRTVEPDDEPLHPLAIDYVLCGAMHGMQVLRRRHAEHIAREGLSFFSAPSFLSLWATFRDAVNQIDPESALADHIVQDARRVFALYRDIARDLMPQPEMLHA